VFAPERLVDVDEDLLLPLTQHRVGKDGGHHFGAAVSRLEDPGSHVELFGRDGQALGDLLQDVRAGLAEPPLDLRQIRVRHAGEAGELAQRDVRLLALLTDEFADRGAAAFRLLYGLLTWSFGYHTTHPAKVVLAIASRQLATFVTSRPSGVNWGVYVFAADAGRVDRALVHEWLSQRSYWARGRPRAVQDAAIDASRNYGMYRRGSGEQVAYARVVTDGVTFAWLCDVFVDERVRGQGIGKRLMAGVMDDLEPLGLTRTLLATHDAHELYAQFGFTALEEPARWMAKVRR
jgi:GNAT superfamily N-acetyltransferase